MWTIPKLFSLLIVSGNGHRCAELKTKLHDLLLCSESTTGYSKVFLFKYGRNEYPEATKKVSDEIVKLLNPYIKDIDDKYFVNYSENVRN